MNRTLIFEGPDGCGKTNISKAVADHYNLPYFKVSTERNNWLACSFHKSVPFDILLPEFCRQTGVEFVSDRSYVSEIVYSSVFERDTDYNSLWQVDADWGSMGAIVVVLLRKDYSAVRDELVLQSKLSRLHDRYELFASQTSCHVVKMHVDDYDNDIDRQLPVLTSAIDRLWDDAPGKKLRMSL